MTKRVIAAIAITLGVASTARSETYRWEDAKGLHFTDNLGSVPQKYRQKALLTEPEPLQVYEEDDRGRRLVSGGSPKPQKSADVASSGQDASNLKYNMTWYKLSREKGIEEQAKRGEGCRVAFYMSPQFFVNNSPQKPGVPADAVLGPASQVRIHLNPTESQCIEDCRYFHDDFSKRAPAAGGYAETVCFFEHRMVWNQAQDIPPRRR